MGTSHLQRHRVGGPLKAFTLAVPLRGDQWTSVFGKSGVVAPTQFAAALANVSSLGMTFGGMGGCFGHGVYVTGGTARWTLSSYTIG